MNVLPVDTPIGRLTLIGSEHGLQRVLWPDEAAPPANEHEGSSTNLEPVAAQLIDYFAGRAATFEVTLDLIGTDFQLEVWQTLREIPYGTTITYAELARRVGRPAAMRAVGAANGRNPVPIVIPCHRVIGSDGTLTGFGGGLEVKRALLMLEAHHASA